MELGLYTDSLPDHTFEQALDEAARVGATAIEIATGGSWTRLRKRSSAAFRYSRSAKDYKLSTSH